MVAVERGNSKTGDSERMKTIKFMMVLDKSIYRKLNRSRGREGMVHVQDLIRHIVDEYLFLERRASK